MSATVGAVNPATAIISPATACSTGTRSTPRNASSLVKRPCSITAPLGLNALTGMFIFARPLLIRPVKIRPRYGSASRIVANNVNLSSGLQVGGATWRTIKSNKGCRSCLGASSVGAAHPCLDDANNVGKSSCSSVAPNKANKSNTRF